MVVVARSFLLLVLAAAVFIGCGPREAGRERSVPALESRPTASAEASNEAKPASDDGFGIVINTGQGTDRKVYVASAKSRRFFDTDAVAVKWVDSWDALAMANFTAAFAFDPAAQGAIRKFWWPTFARDPLNCDVSANGRVAVLWDESQVWVQELDASRSARAFTRDWIQSRADVSQALYISFVEGIAVQPSGRFVAVTVGAKEFEETSGAAYPATALIDLETDSARFFHDGAPIVWLDDDTILLLDTPFGWSSIPDSEAIVISLAGRILGSLKGVIAVGAGPSGTVLVLRSDSEGAVYAEVRSRDLKVRHKRFDTGIKDWRVVDGHRITYIPLN